MPRGLFNRLAQYIGASAPFEDEVDFRRYNSIGGHRTDLCDLADLDQ